MLGKRGLLGSAAEACWGLRRRLSGAELVLTLKLAQNFGQEVGTCSATYLVLLRCF